MRTTAKTFALEGILFMICLVGLYGQDPGWKWAETAGSAIIYDSETDTSGNVVAIGQFIGNSMKYGTDWTVPGSGFSTAISLCIAKYNPAGAVRWAQSAFGDKIGSTVKPLKVNINERGDIAVLCMIRNIRQLKIGKYTLPLRDTLDKLVVTKLGKTGRIHWVRLIEPQGKGPNKISGSDLEIDNLGNVYLTGNFTADSLRFGRDLIQGDSICSLFFVTRYNALGGFDWARTCNYEKNDAISNITSRFMKLTYDGILIAGDYEGRREFYIGSSTLPQDTVLSGFVAKLAFNGSLLWAQRLYGNKIDFVEDISTDLGSNVYITGYYNSPSLTVDTSTIGNTSPGYDLFAAKLRPDGSVSWIRSINTQLAYCNDAGKNAYLHADLLGNLTIVTSYMGASILGSVFTKPNADPGTKDLLMIKLENDKGNIRWIRTGNSIGDDLLSSVTFDRWGSLYMLGVANANTAYDSLNVTDNTGLGGFYLVKINAQGQIKYARPNLNSATGLLDGKKINVDQYSNVYLLGNFSGNDNSLGNVDVTSAEPNGTFVSKFSYISDVLGSVLNADGTAAGGGKIKLFGFTRFQPSPLSDSAVVGQDGTFILKDIPYGKYIVYACPDDAASPKAAPTYYPGASNWQDATQVLVNSDDPVTGITIRLNEETSIAGNVVLGGMIYESDTMPVLKSTGALQAKAVKKADVILVGKSKSTGNMVAYTTTDDGGYFTFSDIPEGSYTVIADIPGMPHESYYDLDVINGQILMNLDYLVGEETIIAQNTIINSLEEPEHSVDNLDIYPNPCRDEMLITATQGLPGMSVVRLMSLSGQCVYEEAADISDGSHSMDVSRLPEGIYLLQVENGSRRFRNKIVRAR